VERGVAILQIFHWLGYLPNYHANTGHTSVPWPF